MKRPDIPFAKANVIDRAIGYFNPARAASRVKARTFLNIAGQYTGARKDRNATKSWSTVPQSADSDTIGDLETLRARSRDLVRNNPLASGAINTASTNVVGTGLKPSPQIDREALGMSAESAEEWERKAERIFNAWAGSTACDVTGDQTFAQMQDLVFRSTLENGDVFSLKRYSPRSEAILGLAVQLIEADRVCNPDHIPSTDKVAGGIEVDANGRPVRYFVANRHPGDLLTSTAPVAWKAIAATGATTGLRQILHHKVKTRIGQRRGVPYLAPVIESLKQLDKYSESELMAAVVSSLFTVFVKSEDEETGGLNGEDDPNHFGPPINKESNVALGTGSIVDLAPNESVEIANPARPNANFDPFFLAIVRQIGVALELPYEVLIKHFTSSYSASRGALETAWQFFRARRAWLAASFCQPVYEWVVAEAVARGMLDAPGFFDDPLTRRAYLGCDWIGPARISLDPYKENRADEIAESHGWKTGAEITAEKTGGDWGRKQERRAREARLRRESELEAPIVPPTEAEERELNQGEGDSE